MKPIEIGAVALLIGAALGWIIFDERLAAADLLGAALVAAALVLVRQGAIRPKG